MIAVQLWYLGNIFHLVWSGLWTIEHFLIFIILSYFAGLGRHELSAEARGALLGEAPVPKLQEQPTPPTPQPSQTTDDLIAKITGRNVNFVSTNEKPKELDFIPVTDSNKPVAKAFRPFMSDPNKQARYERYLKDKEGFASEREADMDAVSEWERNRELVEFEQAAKLYKPLTGIMGDRYVNSYFWHQ